ncbi:sigma-54-dependent transcriptional regulator, partial [Vibrio sp. 1401]|uniref:sigma-54-dependent transcriptional regulator n=1 Tax=Vibrio sp. 1401 TaxID=3074553 RepID=UPI002963DA9B
AIHKVSSRSHKPFMSINCRALNEQRFQAEVFGIAADAEMGPSLLEQADGGTVLFNDILTISKDQQMNLLRFLQEGTIETREGVKNVNVRILAANSSDVEKALIDGDFNEELYHYINVLRINVRSLKERASDIALLARFYLQEFSKEYNSQAKSFSEDALKALTRYFWPGNVRELMNQVKRAVLRSNSVMIEEHQLDLPQRNDSKRNLKTIREKR